jgi:hypothetical protein
MKLERERDIPAFQGKGWLERWRLRNEAEKRDSWIFRLKFLRFFVIFMPAFTLAIWLGQPFFSDRFWLVYISTIVLLWPIDRLFWSLFITPRIRKALESEAKEPA